MEFTLMDLQLFTEGPAEAPAPAEAGGSEAAESAMPNAGDTLADGTQVDARLAAALKDQVTRHPQLKERYSKRAQAMPAGKAGQAEAGTGNTQLEAEWAELKKGKFADLYGADVKKAIGERFKNQADANQQLEKMQPMLDALMKKSGVQSVEELQALILDDDSLYEEEAEAMGMTVAAYKTFKQMKEDHERDQAEKAQSLEEQRMREHFVKLSRQADDLRKTVPNFDLRAELQNPEFLRMTHPDVGLSVEQAYFAVHHNDLMPQAMSYGIQRARQQISQTMQANAGRPVEGAMRGGAPAERVGMDPRNMSRQERAKLIEENRRRKAAGLGGISFD